MAVSTISEMGTRGWADSPSRPTAAFCLFGHESRLTRRYIRTLTRSATGMTSRVLLVPIHRIHQRDQQRAQGRNQVPPNRKDRHRATPTSCRAGGGNQHARGMESRRPQRADADHHQQHRVAARQTDHSHQHPNPGHAQRAHQPRVPAIAQVAKERLRNRSANTRHQGDDPDLSIAEIHRVDQNRIQDRQKAAGELDREMAKGHQEQRKCRVCWHGLPCRLVGMGRPRARCHRPERSSRMRLGTGARHACSQAILARLACGVQSPLAEGHDPASAGISSPNPAHRWAPASRPSGAAWPGRRQASSSGTPGGVATKHSHQGTEGVA